MSDELIEAVHRSLWEDVLDHWFPACISPAGGFHQDFDRAWRATGGEERFIVFQARMTWVCAQFAAAGGGERFAEFARHGLAMLERMIDRRTGTYHWELDAEGRPCGRFAKAVHAYGQAFAIYGLTAAAQTLGSERALAAAKRLFGWLEAYQYDRRFGGYFELTSLHGRPLLRSRTLRRHATGWYKTLNAHLHLFEAFVALYRLWPDATLRLRLEELIALFTDRWWAQQGRVHGKAERNGRPIPGKSSYGHELELAHLLLDAADALGRAGDPALLAKATALVETALEESWDMAGGFFDPQPLHEPLPELVKIWWVQAEGLAALAALHAATGKADYRARLDRQWEWIRSRQIDAAYGGWFGTVASDGRPMGDDVKGKPWKEIYHEVRAAMVVAKALGGAAERVLVRPRN
jgi:mannobiose 2-epimerase